MLEGNIYILHEVLEGTLDLFMHDDDDEGPLYAINESYVHLSFVSMILLQTEQYLWNLGKTMDANEFHMCIDELIFMYSKCRIYLEESEGSPFQLLCALWWLNEASEASLPDLQNKQSSGDFLWRADRFTWNIKQLKNTCVLSV